MSVLRMFTPFQDIVYGYVGYVRTDTYVRPFTLYIGSSKLRNHDGNIRVNGRPDSTGGVFQSAWVRAKSTSNGMKAELLCATL
jgi:hypothetical protein